MKGIDIVYHADNNTMELKDAPDDLLIGTDGDDYATYLEFQIIDDEGILDGFSPYVLFEVESRPMIGLDESYTLNLTQDLLNKARYGKLPFMLVFKGKESTIEIHSANSLTLGIAHSIDADREVEDDSYDSELAIKYVEITYHAESRLMELTDMPDDQFVGTDGDDYATYLRFTMDDPDGLLTGYGARVEFDVSIKDENGDTYKPFIIIDESMSVPLIQRILSNVKYGAIPIQMAFKGTDSEGRTSQYYSLNKLRLSISDSIRALEGIDVNDRIDLNSVINNVEYNPKTATFSFRQIDGGSIAVQLSDLSEEHFEVPTKDDLKKLNKAQNGDTATTLDDGKWYKLYGDYSDPQSWKVMSPSVKAVDDHISDRDNPHNVTKSQIGLGNVDNTSDINKPISTATQNALDTKADSQELSELSKIVSDEIADRESSEGAINESISNHISDTNNPHNVTKEQLGLENVDNTSDINKPISTATQEALDDKADKTTVSSLSNTLTKEIQDRQAGDNTNATAISTHVANKSNPHDVTKAQVGLGNVDNTSDANKPISTATQNALNLKADKTEISALYRPKGSVPTINDLPSNAQIGDVYDVQSTGMNYVWTGSKWDELGAIIDLSPYYTKTEVDSALSSKVSKSGDTMTGTLKFDKRGIQIDYDTTDGTPIQINNTKNGNMSIGFTTNGVRTSLIRSNESDANKVISFFVFGNEGSFSNYGALTCNYIKETNEFYANAPTFRVGTNDNSNKILTIKMANSLPSLVHTTQNETVAGEKTFLNYARFLARPIIKVSGNAMEIHHTGMDYSTSNSAESFIHFYDKSGTQTARIGVINGASKSVSMNQKWNNVWYDLGIKFDGTNGFGYAPTTPTNATGTEIATANWSIGKFVKKTGDTMTGVLTVAKSTPIITCRDTDVELNTRLTSPRNVGSYTIQSKSSVYMGGLINRWYADGAHRTNIEAVSEGGVLAQLNLYANADGTMYATAPNWSVGTNDNSDKVLTIKMANSLPSLLHSTGNETVAGTKVFSNDIYLSGNLNLEATNYATKRIYFVDNSADKKQVGYVGMATDSASNRAYIVANRLVNGSTIQGVLQVSVTPDGVAYGSAPQTPSWATYNEIVTANWSLGKFVALSGDQTIGGIKTFTSPLVTNSGNRSLILTGYDFARSSPPKDKDWAIDIVRLHGKDGYLISGLYSNFNMDGSRDVGLAVHNGSGFGRIILKCDSHQGNIYATCPTTPSTATSNEIATADWTIGKFVQKSGDTMTGGLLIQKTSGGYPLKLEYTTYNSGLLIKRTALPIDSEITGSTNGAKIYFQDAGDVNYAGVITQKEVGHNIISLVNYYEGVSSKLLSLYTYSDGTAYVKHPSWSVGTNDNSDKSLTIKMANSLPSLVHSTGNETVSGVKTHTSYIQSTLNSGTILNATFGNYTNGDTPTTSLLERTYRYEDKAGTRIGQLVYSIQNTKQRNFGLTIFNESQNYKFLGIKVLPDGTFTSECCPTKADATGNEIATANWSIGKFVQKSGDTMSGDLAINKLNPCVNLINTAHNITTTPSSTVFCDIQFFDSTLTRVALLEHYRSDNNRKQLALILNSSETVGVEDWGFMGLANDGYGTYGFAPNWSVGTNDNSDKVLTIKMANSLPSLVHTTGNETVAGGKRLTGITEIYRADCRLIFQSTTKLADLTDSTTQIASMYFRGADDTTNLTYITLARSKTMTGLAIHVRHKNPDGTQTSANGLSIIANSDGSIVSTVPTTPSNATGKEIATADWTLGKFVKKTGDTMSAGLSFRSLNAIAQYVDNQTLDKTVAPSSDTTIYFLQSRDKTYQPFGNIISHGMYTDGRVYWTFGQNATTWQGLTVVKPLSGQPYATAPTPSGKTDNTDKIATTKWVNQTDFLVHSYGNETINGLKVFMSEIQVPRNGVNFRLKNAEITRGTIPSTGKWNRIQWADVNDAELGGIQMDYTTSGDTKIRTYLSNGTHASWDFGVVLKNDGVAYGTAPTTPTNATGNEIATANWVNNKLADKITASTTDIGEGSALATGTLYLVYE